MELVVEGAGPRTIVMVHGWPDTRRLWDGQVAALMERYRCVRFTLPGFERAQRNRAYAIDEVVAAIRGAIEQACPGGKATLLLHDWGCFYGYQVAARHPELVEAVIGVDVGDAGSRRHLDEIGLSGRLAVLAYQLWLALAWLIGGRIGDAMARFMARLGRAPADPRTIAHHMGYPYAVVWLGAAGGARGLKVFRPHCPMLFVYGERKPFMFHSRAWAEELAQKPGNRVIGMPTGHWVMIGKAREFNDAVLSWLGTH